MPARSYTSKPTQIEAIQWRKGVNDDEVAEWTDTPRAIGFVLGEGCGRLWVAANSSWVIIDDGEWVAKDRHGFYPIKDDVFREKYAPTGQANTDMAADMFPQHQGL